MRTHLVLLFTVVCLHLTAEPSSVSIQIDIAHKKGVMKPVWAWFGYDEPNYTYMKDGQ